MMTDTVPGIGSGRGVRVLVTFTLNPARPNTHHSPLRIGPCAHNHCCLSDDCQLRILTRPKIQCNALVERSV